MEIVLSRCILSRSYPCRFISICIAFENLDILIEKLCLVSLHVFNESIDFHTLYKIFSISANVFALAEIDV